MKRDSLRSFLFLPAYNEKFIQKAIASEADAIILDLEDSVPKNKKGEARQKIVEDINEGRFRDKTTFVRINRIEEEEFIDDISSVVLKGIDGLMPAKINDAEDIVFLDKLLSFWERKNHIEVGRLKLAPLIETTKAVEDVYKIAFSSDRIVALCLGGEDYLNELGIVYGMQEEALLYARSKIVNAARARGILPIETPYIGISNLEGFQQYTQKSYRIGFAGCLLVNPKQIETANKSYAPDNELVKESREMVDAAKLKEAKGDGSIMLFHDKMVGPPMLKCAKNVLEQYKMINKE